LLQVLSTEEDAIAPGGDADLATLKLIVICPYLVLVGRRELQLGLLKFREYVSSLLFLEKLIKFPKLSKLVIFDFFNNLMKIISCDPVVEVTTPEQDVVLEQIVHLVILVIELQGLQDLVHVLVSALDFRLRGSQMGINYR